MEVLADLLTLCVTGTEDRHYLMCRGPQIFQKSRRHFKIIDVRKVQENSICTEDPQILGAKVQNLVTWDIHNPGDVEYTFSQNNLLSHYNKHRFITYML